MSGIKRKKAVLCFVRCEVIWLVAAFPLDKLDNKLFVKTLIPEFDYAVGSKGFKRLLFRGEL